MLFSVSRDISRLDSILGRDIESQAEPKGAVTDSSPISNIKESFLGKFWFVVMRAGLSVHEGRAILIRSIAWLSTGILLAILSGRVVLTLAGLVGLLVERHRLTHKAKTRSKAFESDYTALLLSMASSLRAGSDPLTALMESHHLFSDGSVVRDEVLKFREHIQGGVNEAEALRGFAKSIDYSDLDLFRTAMIIAIKEGSALSVCLERLARVTRQRQSFRRKIRTAVALQRVSVWAIAGCTIVICIIQYVANPEAIHSAMAHPIGKKLLLFGGALIIGGLTWMRAMAKERI